MSIVSPTEVEAPKVKLTTRVVNIQNNKNLHLEVEPMFHMEMPPWIQTVNGVTKAFVATSWTGVVDLNSGKNFTSSSGIFNVGSRRLISSSSIYNFGNPTWNPKDIENLPYWRRNYYGVFNTLSVKDSSGKEHILGIMHGENKNEVYGGTYYYDNTVYPPGTTYKKPDQYDGPDENGIWREYSPGYFAFTSLTDIQPSALKNGTLNDGDMGPVLWPSAGYLSETNQQASQGIRHPTGFATNEHIYIYYLDTSKGYEPGRTTGLKVARAPISSLGKPGSFRNYYNGKWEEKSLPDGFNKNSRDMFYKQGGRSTTIIPGGVIRFSVAKVKGTPYYLGVEETWTNDGLSIMLRASKDLANWGDPVTIANVASGVHAEGVLHYPIFYNKDFTSSVEIDMDEFYVGGTFGPGTPTRYFQYVKLSVDIKE